MAFRERMQTVTSKAEVLLDIEERNRGLDRFSVRNHIIFLDNGEIYPMENVTRQMATRPWTMPDRIYRFPHKKPLPVYLDGHAVHKTRGVKNRDDNIDKLLRKLGLTPLRFSYSGALSQKKLKEIVDKIEEAML